MNANLFFSIVCGLCMIVFFMVILMTTNRQRVMLSLIDGKWQFSHFYYLCL